MRRPVFMTVLIGVGIFVVTTLWLANQQGPVPFPTTAPNNVDNVVSEGGVISARLNNATIKAELGRSTWKLLHTMAAQYPEEPTEDERLAFSQFIHLLSRLYPCGECAEHFQKLLAQYPPQTSSRAAAAQWTCAIHNKVNERLGKQIFDCDSIMKLYPCGCEDEQDKSVLTKEEFTKEDMLV